MKYLELKNYFIDNQDHLPKTLRAQAVYYPDVMRTALSYIHLIDSNIRTLGKLASSKNIPTMAALNNLRKLKTQIDSLDGWDEPRPELSKFQNKML